MGKALGMTNMPAIEAAWSASSLGPLNSNCWFKTLGVPIVCGLLAYMLAPTGMPATGPPKKPAREAYVRRDMLDDVQDILTAAAAAAIAIVKHITHGIVGKEV